VSLTCSHCSRVLEYSGEPPSFCAYCGSRLAPAATATFDHEAVTVAPREGGSVPGGVPVRVGGYRLLRPLGAGGMGSVFEAEDTASGRHVALKLIAPEFATSPESVERFRQEGRLASAIVHPRCVFVLAADEDAGRPYIVMELMPGDTLETLVQKQGPLPPEEALARILDVIEGLQEAHRLGVVHRDIKPSNCFLEADGRVKVGDFGLAKSLVNQAHLTRTGTFLGTLLYCSPEQVRGEPVDPQSDVYSVAATLYYLLAGKAPFQTGDAAATLARIVSDPPPPLRGLRPDIPAALEQVVLRGLERDRQRRWRSLDDFRAALLPFVPGRLSIGGVGLRLAAYLLDRVLLLPLALPGIFLFTRSTVEPVSPVLLGALSALYLVIELLYFGVAEGLWGCTPGKRCLRLRVWTATGSDPPGLPRALLRAAIWFTLTSLPNWMRIVLTDPLDLRKDQTLSMLIIAAQFLVFALGLVIIASPMRARNGYRCLHDLLSGTRVILLPEPERRWSLPGRRLEDRLTPAGGPARLGGFAVRGALGRGPAGQVLLGEDPVLRRQVLLWLRPPTEPALERARRDVSRPTRLRWLAAGEAPEGRWDACLAPAGCSLPDLVADRGKLSWPELRPLLEQLTDELAAACGDGTLPASLNIRQVWVQSNGQALLLETPLEDPAPAPAQPGAAADQRPALALLGEVAVLALEGRARAAGAPPAPPRAPVPEHARRLLGQLLGVPRPFAHVKNVQAALAATRARPVEVSRPRRAAHLAVLTAFLWFMGVPLLVFAVSMAAFTPLFIELMRVEQGKYAAGDLEQGAAREFVAAELTPSAAARLAAWVQLDADLRLKEQVAERGRRDRTEEQAHVQTLSWPLRLLMSQVVEPQWRTTVVPTTVKAQREQQLRDGPPSSLQWFRGNAGIAATRGDPSASAEFALFVSLLVGLAPAVWVVWAFVVRGGLSFRVLGLSLVRGDGRPAPRWCCGWRALLVWAPVAGLAVASVWLNRQYWVSWEAGAPSTAVLWLATLAAWAPWAVLLGYVGLALWHPARALHDRLAGTYLVPP
jgi:hypothetical protein